MKDILTDLTALLLDLQHSLRTLPTLYDEDKQYEATALIGTEHQRILDQLKLFATLRPEFKSILKESLDRLEETNKMEVKKELDYMG
jgi:hypothetical protein